ncbi:SCO family protein [Shewanella frigidimarina]|uniref:SCO family protein n=1 Tax=Shewanella TaxID=22 RepID=UPI000C7C5310|nr:SCO family protein [Shewanella sp. 11B5]RPA32087.1 SCO family protein [Shewanella frigidimarina]|tara:strand:+ start:189665 stop:190279 length:615 start_codon:yes stop_codon:yes gene_type:complete
MIAVGLMLLALVGGVVYQQTQTEPMPLATSYVFEQQRPLAPFTLADQYGNAFTNQTVQGKWSLFFIGYTACPDVCPTTLNKLAAAYPQLQKIASNVQVVFVSADPKRDTQAKRLDYINFFNKDFKAVSAEHTDLFPFSRDLGFVYAMVGEDSDYQVDHSASYVLVSPRGEKIAVFKPKPQPGQLAQILNAELISDFSQIVQSWH